MSGGQPLKDLWWLVSRASGIVALVLISASVILGLAMASRALRKPAARRAASRLHEHMAITAVAAIGLHGVALLGDQWLKPGWRGITVPFAMSYRPGFTGVGIIGGYLIVLLGPSFYLRRRIGARRWRRLHPLMMVAWLLALVHTLGSGSDAPQLWLRAIVLAPLPVVAYLGVARLAARRRQPRLVSVQAAAGQAADTAASGRGVGPGLTLAGSEDRRQRAARRS